MLVQKQAMVQIWPLGHSLLTPGLGRRNPQMCTYNYNQLGHDGVWILKKGHDKSAQRDRNEE